MQNVTNLIIRQLNVALLHQYTVSSINNPTCRNISLQQDKRRKLDLQNFAFSANIIQNFLRRNIDT